MEVVVTKTYIKQFSKCPNHIKQKCRELLNKLEQAKSLEEIEEVKKLKGFKRNFFRIRVANYRVGIEEVKPKIIILSILERGQIYKNFPPK